MRATEHRRQASPGGGTGDHIGHTGDPLVGNADGGGTPIPKSRG